VPTTGELVPRRHPFRHNLGQGRAAAKATKIKEPTPQFDIGAGCRTSSSCRLQDIPDFNIKQPFTVMTGSESIHRASPEFAKDLEI
jgi:hypothetical protein